MGPLFGSTYDKHHNILRSVLRTPLCKNRAPSFGNAHLSQRQQASLLKVAPVSADDAHEAEAKPLLRGLKILLGGLL